MALNKPTSKTSCVDSDGGKNYFVQGKAAESVNGQVTATSYDSCQGSSLIEAFCTDEGISTTEMINCPSNFYCIDGVCLSSSTTTKKIKVLSPNGGEKWTLGNKYQVNFSQSGMSGEAKVSLIRQGQENTTACLL